jgi:Lrp/AsnC family transcriptional regulator, leucine-responsive regulatory protein
MLFSAHDAAILRLVQKNRKLGIKKIAEKVGVDSSSVSRTITAFTKSGHIEGIKAILNPLECGFLTLAYIKISLKDTAGGALRITADSVAKNDCVQSVHRIAGEFDLFVKIRCTSNDHLSQITDEIKKDENILKTETIITTTTYKETLDIPIGLLAES